MGLVEACKTGLDDQVQEVVFHNQELQDMVVMVEVEAVPWNRVYFTRFIVNSGSITMVVMVVMVVMVEHPPGS